MAETVQLRSLSPAEREALADRAAAALDRGALVLLPTETVYGIAASAADADALGRLAACAPGVKRTISAKAVGPNGFTWHASGTKVVLEALRPTMPVHRRIVEKLTPGAVRLIVEAGDRRALAGEIPGAFATGGLFSVRVPDHAWTRSVLRRTRNPIAMDRVSSAISSTGRALDGKELDAAVLALGVTLCVDDGPTRFGTVSTALQLTNAGGYKVEAPGALPASEIDEAVPTRVLFVCSGNTCRSPMAERIAQDLLERSMMGGGGGVGVVKVSSAGISAAEGEPATREGTEALARLGIEAGGKHHRSRGLTRQMIEQSDYIFAMTKKHRDVILGMVPDAADRVMLLDRAGDIPDPIGSGAESYRKTAEKIAAGILDRFAEKKLVVTEGAKQQKRARAAGEKP